MKILVLHCGGTISCEERDGVLCPRASIEPYFDALCDGRFTFTHRRIEPFLSELLNGSRLSSILFEVQKALAEKAFAGIIVTHGSDTVAYTSAFLGYALGLSVIPVVTVSADKPLSDASSSGHAAIVTAVSLIVSGGHRGVFSAWREHAHRGTRILRHRAYENDLFSTSSVYGKCVSIAPVIGDLEKDPEYRELPDGISPLTAPLGAQCPVWHVYVTPSLTLPYALPDGCKAVILRSYHSGTVDVSNRSIIRLCELCKERSIPVFVDGVGACGDYESSLAYKALGILRAPSLISPEALYMKLWMLIENGVSPLTGAIGQPLGGDLPPL